MERSSTIFAVSSHFYDSPHNRGHYHRAAGTPATPRGGDARKRPAAATYTWVVEQELAALSKEISETRQWAFEQQAYFGLLPKGRARPSAEKRPRDDIKPSGRNLDKESTAWLRDRLRAAEVRGERIQLQEEFDQMEARWRERIGREERRRRQEYQWAEEQRARAEKQKQLERRSQEEEAWRAYERRWSAITGDGSSRLTFKSIPWPTTVPPRSAAEITPAAVAKFIFSPAHSEGVSRKERIRSALRRWHPDRFGRVLSRVDEKDKGAVERGVGVVARCLNELLAQEN